MTTDDKLLIADVERIMEIFKEWEDSFLSIDECKDADELRYLKMSLNWDEFNKTLRHLEDLKHRLTERLS